MKIYWIILSICLGSFSSYAQVFNVKDYGAKGNGIADDTQAVQLAIDACSAHGGGQVVFPSGIYPTGMVNLKSNIDIWLMRGCRWQAIADLSRYPELKVNSRSTFIFARNQKNISIHGDGTIYGSGDAHDVFIPAPGDQNKSPRIYGLLFFQCSDLNISGITLKNSAFWMLRTDQCDNVQLRNVKVYNHANFNNDGFDIVDCHRVIISDCILDCEDDAICFKSETDRGTVDATVTNCILSSHASAIKCGTGSYGAFNRITVSNCVIKPSLVKESFHPMQLFEGLAGIDFSNTDGAKLSNIMVNNIVIDGVETPVFIRLGNRNRVYHPELSSATKTNRTGQVENITISNIRAVNVGPVACSVSGFPGAYVKNIHLSNIDITLAKNGSPQDTITNVPENSDNYPMSRMFRTNLPAYGFYLRHVKNIILDHVTVRTDKVEARYELVADDVKNIHVSDFRADNPGRNMPFIRFSNVLDANLDRSLFKLINQN